jgi:beta-glucosidase
MGHHVVSPAFLQRYIATIDLTRIVHACFGTARRRSTGDVMSRHSGLKWMLAMTSVAAATALTGHPALAQMTPDAAQVKARSIEARMTDDERFGLIKNIMVVNFRLGKRDPRVPAEIQQTAGWAPGVPRLGIPDLVMTDASLGITNPLNGRKNADGTPDSGTAFPAGLATGSTWNMALARRVGVALGLEAKQRGFNVHLGGGINLMRDVRHGRNFEYISEDPLVSGMMGAESVIGTQSVGVMAELKHVSLNSHELGKFTLDARIDPAAHREAELLGFAIGIERGNPGALMCAYNKVNGAYNCGNQPIMQGVIKDAIGFRGFILSDWQAVYSWDYALAGLDMHSGAQLDKEEWFGEPLRHAVAEGKVPKARISEMVQRILYGVYISGIDKWKGPQGTPDLKAHADLALEVGRQGIVLLKNDGILPLASGTKKTIAVIGGYGHLGTLVGGGGSSLMLPKGTVMDVQMGGEGGLAVIRNTKLIGPSPVDALKKAWPEATVIFDPGEYPAQAAALAKRADIVILLGIRFESEGYDAPDMSLPNGQDALFDAVLSANPNSIVVLQTGNPVAMPWRDKAKAIMQAWYQGQNGATAITEILTGAVNPSGRLPLTWFASVEQTPHPVLTGFESAPGTPLTIDYKEGAEVGYRWLAKTGETPIYPFGHGLTYTNFAYGNFKASGGKTVTASFTVTNTGSREGADVSQVYLTAAPGEKRQRLIGFERVSLKPGESRTVTVTVDPRMLARFDGTAGQWRISAGSHHIVLGPDATTVAASADVKLEGQLFGK